MGSTAFDPLTFGYEWETLLTGKNMIPIKSDEVKRLGRKLQAEFPETRTGTDHIRGLDSKFLEIRSGILSDYQGLDGRTRETIGAIKRVCREKDLVFFPLGSHPLFGKAAGYHLHVGSVYSLKVAQDLARSLTPYVPLIAAFMANSPFWGISEPPGGFKSYRVKYFADWCSTVIVPVERGLGQFVWGNDVLVKGIEKPTVEIRVMDSPLSVSLLAEASIFIVALTLNLAERRGSGMIDRNTYMEYVVNRRRAARWGLQALFDWRGERVPASDILEELVGSVLPAARKLGLDGFELLEKMARKRVTQADFLLSLYDGGDLHVYTRDLGNLLERERDPFADFLEEAPELPVVEAESAEDMILSHITIETPFRLLYESLEFPYDFIEDVVEEFRKRGLVKVSRAPEKGILLTRIR